MNEDINTETGEVKKKKFDMSALYFKPEKIEFLPSGCAVLDGVLGGGYAEGRVINIVGDRASGKTLLVEEAAASHILKYPNGRVDFVEPESALSGEYVEKLGLPPDKINWSRYKTVEEMFDHCSRVLETLTSPQHHSLYILDSLDSLSDAAELEREIDDQTYGGNKPKKLSELFRRLNQEIESKNMTMMIISQLRDSMSSYGPSQKRSGGRALDFYSSQIVWLTYKENIKRSSKGFERSVGVTISAKTTKNKAGRPFRECQLDLLYERGIDDIQSNLDWLSKVEEFDLGIFPKLGTVTCEKGKIGNYAKKVWFLDQTEFIKMRELIAKETMKTWIDVEARFNPPANKKWVFPTAAPKTA